MVEWECEQPQPQKGAFHEQDNTGSEEKARGSFMGEVARKECGGEAVWGKLVERKEVVQEV